MKMKALTIIQPFAELIARGEKRVENRTWNTTFRGRFAIHAGKSKSYGGEPASEIAYEYGIDPKELTFGAIIATADLVDCVRLIEFDADPFARRRPCHQSQLKHPWLNDHEHTEGPYCFVIENVTRVHPISIRGALDFWDVNRVAAQYGVDISGLLVAAEKAEAPK